MAVELVMPQLTADMQEGQIVRWLKAVGDSIEKGEVVVEIETDKAEVEVESYEVGVLEQILVAEGETVPCGTPIALVATAEGSSAAQAPTPADSAEVKAEVAESTPATQPVPAPRSTTRDGSVRASPVAKKMAESAGIDLTTVQGTGPGGRIVQRDVQKEIDERGESAPTAAPAATSKTGDRMRQTIARRMSQSKREIPHFYISVAANVSEAERLRSQLNQEDGVKITVTDVVVKATALALQSHPRVNAWYEGDALELKSTINIGLAIALEHGLIAPALIDCEQLSLWELSRASQDLAARAKAGKIRAQEYAEATFTLSNLGMFGVDEFVAIINPPQVAILALGRVRDEAVVEADQISTAKMMTLTLSCDHRSLDGAEAARFLSEVVSLLEAPYRLIR